MAMTKKERAEFDAAILRAETMAALRWTAPVEKDVSVPDFGKQTTGFEIYCGADFARVQEKWSGSVSHGDMPKSAHHESQRGIELHSTRLRALMALRHEVEKAAAKRLLRIDQDIAAELASQP